jgi:hypothetical protein
VGFAPRPREAIKPSRTATAFLPSGYGSRESLFFSRRWPLTLAAVSLIKLSDERWNACLKKGRILGLNCPLELAARWVDLAIGVGILNSSIGVGRPGKK